MGKDERDLLEVLKAELDFLEKGGYRPSPREPRKFNFIFEDSPTCMNYDSKDNPDPCNECVLMPLVPPEARTQTVPCRHIPLNAEGETLESLYRYADQRDLEDVYGKWLRGAIAALEEQRRAARSKPNLAAAPTGPVPAGEPLFGKLHPKCANPACVTAFHWLAGGRFYRFGIGALAPETKEQVAESAAKTAPAKHYWLCESCSQVYTLEQDVSDNVVVKVLWPEIAANTEVKGLTAA
jgi:hypothetical protein